MGNEFDTDTALARAGDSTFVAQVTDRWNTPIGPNGGYVLAFAARALGMALPMPDPLAISAHFLRAPSPGEATIEVEQVRAGRRHATGIARMSQNGKGILTVIGTFADLSKVKGRDLVLNEPPPLPSPDDCVDPLGAFAASVVPSIVRRFDYRVAEAPGAARGEPSGRPAYDSWVRFADGREPDTLALVAFPDSLLPTVFEIAELGSTTVEMSVHVRGVPAPGWLAMRVSTRHVIAGYHEEDVEVWDSNGRLVAQARQLALVASALARET